MSKTKKVIGAKEFKQRIINTLKSIDKNIKEDDLHFSQTATNYYMAYRPKYPERSNGDFLVSQDLNGSISIYGNMGTLVPTIKHYIDIDDFKKQLLKEEIILTSTPSIEQLFELACNGNTQALAEYWNTKGSLNVRYESFGKKHSLIMGAFRNQQYNTAIWLKNHSCSLTDEEQEEINKEYLKLKTIKLLVDI